MKKLILFIAGILTLSTGCKKQLEEHPQARFTISNLNPSILNAFVIGAYEPLSRSRGRLWESSIGTTVEGLAEYCYLFPSNPVSGYSSYNFAAVQDNTLPASWTTYYETIGKCNLLIKTIDNDTQMAAADKQVARGEASFIRAICYYWLVRLWGNIPMRLVPITGTNDVGTPLSAPAVVYTQIVSDLKFAESVLPAKVSTPGRATSGAAKTALADVYLTTKDFVNARAKSLEIMTNKATYGYDLVTDLPTLFSPTAATNSEDIFSIKFDQIAGYGSFLPVYAGEARAKAAGEAARGLFFLGARTIAPLISGWDKKDKRRGFNLIDSVTIGGVKQKTQLPVPYFIDYFFGKYQDPNAADEVGAGNDFYLYRYADVLLIFAEAENQLNGPTSAAYDAINQVRRRGYYQPITTASALADLPAGLTQQQFDDMIFRERGYEFMFEDKRWFDMERTSRTAAVTAAASKPVPTLHYLLLPNIEINNNPALH